MSEGLDCEEKALDGALEIQRKGWRIFGFKLVKVVRTYKHKSPRIRELDGKKIDLVAVFERGRERWVTVIQIKSTVRSFEEFVRKFGRSNVYPLMIQKSYSQKKVIRELMRSFKYILSKWRKPNQFCRKDIPIEEL